MAWCTSAIADRAAGGVGIADSMGLAYATAATLIVIVAGTWLAGYRLWGCSFTGDE